MLSGERAKNESLLKQQLHGIYMSRLEETAEIPSTYIGSHHLFLTKLKLNPKLKHIRSDGTPSSTFSDYCSSFDFSFFLAYLGLKQKLKFKLIL